MIPMSMDMYFGADGISSTQAENICSVANEMVKGASTKLETLSIVNVTVTTVDTVANPKLINQGCSEEQFKLIPSDLEKIGFANGLNAWLREAIKAKKQLLNKATSAGLDDYLEASGRTEEYKNLMDSRPVWSEFLEKSGLKKPEAPRVPNKSLDQIVEDVKSEQSIKDWSHYLMIEAKASVLGNAVHHKGEQFKGAMDALLEANSKPNRMIDRGSTTLIESREGSIPLETATKIQSDLQAKYREYESELNRLKQGYKSVAEDRLAKMQDDYREASAKYKADFDQFNSSMIDLRTQFKKVEEPWNSTLSDIESDYRKWMVEERSRVSKLKIVIPKVFGEKTDSGWTGFMGEVMSFLQSK